MLREVIDMASLEDFAGGLARAARLRVCFYDAQGELIIASRGDNEFARLTGHVLRTLPPNPSMTPVPAHDPPACVAFVESQGVWYVVAPVYDDDTLAGYVGVGEFREGAAAQHWRVPAASGAPDQAALQAAWQSLPPLDRNARSHAVTTARWAARQVAQWGHREAQLAVAHDEVALIGDIADLLTGEEDLQTVVDRIVAKTAHVMKCPSCAMRLYNRDTNQLTIKAVYNLPASYVGQGAIVRTASAVDIEALKGRVVYIEDAGQDVRVHDPAAARRRRIVSVLSAGMVYRGDPVGVLRVYTTRRRRFRKAQRDLLHTVAQQAASAIVHARLVQERLQAAETQRQLALAGDLQARIVRSPPPHHPRVETALIFEPCHHVAGDFCDFLTLCDGRMVVVVADVVGKGIPASLLMATARGALRATAEVCLSPGEMLARLNRQIWRDTLTNEFVTLLLVTIDREARQLTYCNAGHEPLLLLRGGEVTATDEADMVLGVNPAEVYHEHTLPLEPDDRLLLYTDGVCEARNFADEVFGRERVWESLRAYGHLMPEQILDNVRWDVRRFVGLAEQSDDLTLVALRIVPLRDVCERAPLSPAADAAVP